MPSTTVDSFVMVDKTQVQTVETIRATFCPTDKPRTKEEGLNFEQIVAGTGHPKKEQQKWFGTESSSWYKRIQTQLFSELYGESSFLQEYMRSEASSENYHVAITNWELEAKILRLARAFPSAL
ncbi:hypothetical protein HBI38_123550 [Parastagonospora nodorum]|nr:hypothetical protein HBI73_197890 [Parastagonospora nodorum]KAH5158187.1 hypothetical protein HBH69_073960 [Parastagonospora nodorum]KAH6257723.1 hypothetical protein HBI41_157000 [Parastagonospora nodorum]KAH6281120.1 hypothetical protein HBI40_168090 [Parastagonospora nodorum]KAH6318774.1 hypothetical protein HBI38_123550 [Parastagonospora nodorum]